MIIDNPQSQGLIASLVTKIINNLQVTVRNIHVRYEDKLSVPGVCERDHAIVCNLMLSLAFFSIHSLPA